MANASAWRKMLGSTPRELTAVFECPLGSNLDRLSHGKCIANLVNMRVIPGMLDNLSTAVQTSESAYFPGGNTRLG